jgi:hypothetical protein
MRERPLSRPITETTGTQLESQWPGNEIPTTGPMSGNLRPGHPRARCGVPELRVLQAQGQLNGRRISVLKAGAQGGCPLVVTVPQSVDALSRAHASGDFGSNGPGATIAILPDPGSREGKPEITGVFWRWTREVQHLGEGQAPRQGRSPDVVTIGLKQRTIDGQVSREVWSASSYWPHQRRTGTHGTRLSVLQNRRGGTSDSRSFGSGFLLWVILSKGDDHVEH